MASRGKSQHPNPTSNGRTKNKNRHNAAERPKRFTPRKRTSESEDDGICDLCVQKISIYAIGHCDHPICYRCSAKMRILCKQLDCAVCRVPMKKVIYSNTRREFTHANAMQLIHHPNHNASFTDDIVKKEYGKLFDHRCSVCTEEHLETSFEKLEGHMRKDHKLFYCNLCVRFNTNFTDECKAYTREMLARHRRVGDDDDTSHKGHPLCEFCDERYHDNDSLLHHLRKDHYFCHFCDKDGKNQYYDGYVDLRQHYRKDHFLCEEGDCINEQFTSVFASELDLKAHRAAAHKDGLSRQQQKVERNIDLGFQYAKPARSGGRVRRDDPSGPSSGRGGGRMGSRNGRGAGNEDSDLARALALSEQEHARENARKREGKGDRPRVQRDRPEPPPEREPTPPPDLVKDFPTLGDADKEENVDPYAYTSVRKTPQEPVAKSDIPDTQQAALTAAHRLAVAAGRSVGTITKDDFPSLGASQPNRAASTGLWSSSNAVRTNIPVPVKPQTNSSAGFRNTDDFPTLGGRPPPPVITKAPSGPKKPVSVNMPQSKFTSANVNLRNDEEFPTLGGRNTGSSNAGLWGPGVSVATVSKKKSKKPKTPLATAEAPRPKPKSVQTKSAPVENPETYVKPASLHREYDPLSHNEAVSIRIGSHKHTVRLATTDYSAALEGVEKPVEVPGIGTNSVRTVSAEAFSLLAKSAGNSCNPTGGDSKFDSGNSDFPELGGSKAGRIKGVRTPLSSYTKPKVSLSSLSKEILNKSETANRQSKSTPNYNDDFPSAISNAPSLSSYDPDWYDANSNDNHVQETSKSEPFAVEATDFPSLSAGKAAKPNVGGKKKKKKKIPSVNDLSKHFGTAPVDNDTRHLDDLLLSQKNAGNRTLSQMLETGKPTSSLENGFEHSRPDGSNQRNSLEPRPDKDDIEGRNIWLITTVQRLCGDEENFSEFKSSSGQFRQGRLSATRYYQKCRVLLGKEHFKTVFMELVDLLPDADKQEELMRAHNDS